MRKLKKEYMKRGIRYTKVGRDDKFAFYMAELHNARWFEVFRIKVGKERIIDGVTIEEGEMFPSDEPFGKWAWTFPTMDGCVRKAEALLEKERR